MIARMKVVGLGVLVALLCGAATAGTASAKKAKPVLILKVADEGKRGGKVVTPGTSVPAGWFVSLAILEEKHVFCQVLPEEEGEKEASMVLTTNSNKTADKATGTVAAPPCWEEVQPAPSKAAAFKHRAHARRHTSIADVTEPEFKKATGVSLSGSLASQTMTIKKHKGTLGLSASLVLTVTLASGTCAYEDSAKTIAAKWPPKYSTEEPEKKEEEESFPYLEDTANLVAEPTLTLDKALTTSTKCEKSEAAFVESWLGPLGEEFEAELT